MAPLSQALALEHVESTSSKQSYSGVVDPDWLFGGVPMGGYVLSLLLAGCMKYQEETKHPDPVHVTAHFLLPVTISQFNIEVENVRVGSRFSNLLVKWTQDREIKVMTHMVFGILPAFDAPPSDKTYEDIPPSHPLYHTLPISSHPSTLSAYQLPIKHFGFAKHIQSADDPITVARNKSKLVAPPGTHEGGLEGGIWQELTENDAHLGLAMIPVFADLYYRTPVLLSQAHGEGFLIRKYPTVVLTLEFKRQLPRPEALGYSRRTLGLYSRNLFLDHGRHGGCCEIWSAPSNIGEVGDKSADDECWKRDMRCIAVADQLALTAPLGGGETKAEEKAKL